MRPVTKWAAWTSLLLVSTTVIGANTWAKPAKKAAPAALYSLCNSAEEIVFNFNAPQTSPGSGGFPDDNGGELKPFLGKDVVSVCFNRATAKLRLSAAENGVVRLNFTPTADNKFRYAHAYGADRSSGWGYLCFDQRGVRYQLRVYNPADIGADFTIVEKSGRERDFFASYGQNPTWKGKRHWYLAGLNIEYLRPNGGTVRNTQRLAEIFFEPGVMANFSDFAFSQTSDYAPAICGAGSFQ